MRSTSVGAVLGVAAAMTILGATGAEAQRPLPRVATAAPPSAPQRPTGRAADAPPYQVLDPRFPPSANDPRYPRDPRFPQSAYDPRHTRPAGSWDGRRQRQQSGGSTVIVVPAPGIYGYGYSYGYAPGAYYPSNSYGGVYDANGRPLSTSLEPAPSTGGYGYTPDLSGAPYEVTNEGMMVVDFDGGERRAFPSCAAQTDSRDPDGRPRTVFYQPSDYWMVLRPGQRGRVQGTPPAGTTACYAIDSVGRVVLRY